MYTNTMRTDGTSLSKSSNLNKLVQLPEHWDPSNDLLVIIGEGAEKTARMAQAYGQDRILVFLNAHDESPDSLQNVMVATSLQEVMTNLFVLPGPPPTELVGLRCAGSTQPMALVTEIMRTAQYCIEQRQSNIRTLEAFGLLWGLHGILNLPEIANWPTAHTLVGAFSGKPMVIVNPGPSLADDLQHLKDLKGRAIVVCVNHAMSALTAAGIVPDFVITLEPQDIRYHFEGADMSAIEAHIVAATANPGIFQIPTSRFLTYTGSQNTDRWIYDVLGDEDAEITGGGSVSCSALSLGLLWGCSPIINVGLDLSFPNGQYYTPTNCDGGTVANISDDGTYVLEGYSEELTKTELYADLGHAPRNPLCEVPAVNGGTVPTSSSFKFYLHWFKITAQDHRDSTRLINCSTTGALIDGMDHMPLSEALEKHVTGSVNVRKAMDEVVNNHNRIQRLTATHDHLVEMDRYMTLAADYASKCMKLSAKAASKQSALDKLDRVEKKLIQALKPLCVASLIDQKQIIDAVKRGSEATTMEDSIRFIASFYMPTAVWHSRCERLWNE